MTESEIVKRLNEIKATLNEGLDNEGSDMQYLCENAESMLSALINTIEHDNR